jgi:hypothetical protein
VDDLAIQSHVDINVDQEFASPIQTTPESNPVVRRIRFTRELDDIENA